MKSWLLQEPAEVPRAARRMQPEIVVHYWDGAAPEGRGLRDISETGVYILTSERWYLGTIIRIILQRHKSADGRASEAPTASICVNAQVVREGADGVAMEFVFRTKAEREQLRLFLAELQNQPANPSTSAAAGNSRSGQALVEFALIMPLVFLLAVNAVNFGGFLFAWVTVANAARTGAQYMVMSSDSPGSPTPASSTQITSLVTNDVTSLLNKATISVATCSNATTSSNACTTLTDPEAPSYTLATVEVTYTYAPLIPLFSFPKLGISATLPNSTIHRQVVMRMMQ